jgi:hypothetical protein
MLAYHNDPTIKEQILAQLQAHHDADEFVKGVYWENGKGCAVGCTLHSDDHLEYESRFGIPVSVAHLIDALYEGLPNPRAKRWPIDVMSAIRVGADLSKVTAQFLHWLLVDPLHGVIRFAPIGSQQAQAIFQVASLYQRVLTDQII